MSDAREFLEASKPLVDEELTDITLGPWEVETIPETGESRIVRRFEFFGEQIEVVARGGLTVADAEFIAHARTALPKMRAALEAVLELHPSVPLGALGQYPGEDELPVCEVCDDGSGGYEAWPCPTVRAIESALKEGDPNDQ